MKKLLFIAAFFSLSAVTVFAQRGQQRDVLTPEQKAEKMTSSMAEKLELSEAQQKQVYEIYLEQATARKAEMEARREEMRNRRSQMQEQNKVQREKIEAVLSPDQKAKLEELKDERREKHQNLRDARQNPDSDKIREWRKGRSGKKSNHR